MVRYFTALSFFVLILFFPVLLHAQPLRVMCLGNSITQAAKNHAGYRFWLWQKLIDEGINTELVGSHNMNEGGASPKQNVEYKGHTFTNRNEGHWGWRADEVLHGKDGTRPSNNKLQNWLAHYIPDVVLIHLGTNDIFQGQSVHSTIQDITSVITKIRERNPYVCVYLAQVIPANLSHDNIPERLTELNTEIAKLVPKLNTSKSPVVLVDQHTGFDAAAYTYDNVHPNEEGEQFMAERWFEAMSPRIVPLPVSLVSLNARLTPDGNVTITWKTASERNNHYFEVQRASSDSSRFETIGRVKGSGTTNAAKTYTFQDELPPAGNLYYRLRQVDTDGTATYTQLVSVQKPQEEVALHIYPTVAREDHVTVNLQVKEPNTPVGMIIYAANGSIVQTITGKSDISGSFRRVVPLENLDGNGLYIIKAIADGHEMLRKFIADQ